jgi:hypothetical protein
MPVYEREATYDGLVGLVVGFVEHESWLAGVHSDHVLDGLEAPVQVWLGLSFEYHVELPVELHFVKPIYVSGLPSRFWSSPSACCLR